MIEPAEPEKEIPTLTLARRLALPLYSHKIDSDQLGKHEYWPPVGHIVAEVGAVAMDIGVNYAVLELFNRKGLGAAAATALIYRVAVELIPDQVAKLSKTVIANPKT